MKICMFVPSGTRWFDSYDKALTAAKELGAVTVKRWMKNRLTYEDHKDAEGKTVAQLVVSK
jgi:hypothetical protein